MSRALAFLLLFALAADARAEDCPKNLQQLLRETTRIGALTYNVDDGETVVVARVTRLLRKPRSPVEDERFEARVVRTVCGKPLPERIEIKTYLRFVSKAEVSPIGKETVIVARRAKGSKRLDRPYIFPVQSGELRWQRHLERTCKGVVCRSGGKLTEVETGEPRCVDLGANVGDPCTKVGERCVITLPARGDDSSSCGREGEWRVCSAVPYREIPCTAP